MINHITSVSSNLTTSLQIVSLHADKTSPSVSL